jgi:Ca2+-binding EF-hand superfamily protein
MKRVITTIGSLAITAAVSLAQDDNDAPGRQPRPNQPEGFAKLDRNHDGMLNFREFAARFDNREARSKAEMMFKRLDKNGDHSLTPDEFNGPRGDQPGEKPPHPEPAEVFLKMDTDGDGSLSLAEFLASPAGQKGLAQAEEFFKRMDKDGDGSVSRDEFRAAHQPQPPPVKPQPPRPADVFQKLDTNHDGELIMDEILASEMGRNNPEKAREHFEHMDKNDDGKVTPDEFHAFNQSRQPTLEEIFRKMDTNDDGYISLDEFRAAHPGRKDAVQPPKPEPGNSGPEQPESNDGTGPSVE